jgi:pyridoxal phosphate phosphatase PHOSPHO2
VLYVGDGGNDLCPAQSLGPDDVVFVRAGYALEKLLQDPAVRATVTARVHVWNDAAELPAFLKDM